MDMSPPDSIGELELQVWRYVADHPGVTVADVAGEFARQRSLARTTILTVMERLRTKRYLRRHRAGGSYQYFTRRSKSRFLQSLVGQFLDRALGGSLDPFVAYLMHDAKLTDKQFRELKQFVEESKRRRKRGSK
jgi:predicted transcriptional regulator